MPVDVMMPKLSDTMEEGKILKWLKHPGDHVAIGEIIAEVETDKANVEIEAFGSGVLRKIVVEEGGTVPVGEMPIVGLNFVDLNFLGSRRPDPHFAEAGLDLRLYVHHLFGLDPRDGGGAPGHRARGTQILR